MAIGTMGTATGMRSGRIKKLVPERGFGFVTGDDGRDYFFHRNDLEAGLDFDRLVGGERVLFAAETGPKGPHAVRVQPAQPAARR